ncbi:MAG: MFS transporter [Actinobacteria bacterium]|nr:MFS transporter [Actinomycetota bacterium]
MATTASTVVTDERTVSELLTDPTFGRYFAGNLISNCGNWIQNVAAATAVFSITRSATLTGVVSGALWLGALVLQPYAGAVSDRVDRRRMLLAGQSLSLAAATVLAAWTVAVGLEGLPGPWPIIGVTVVIGIGNAISIPAMQALVPALVPPADLEQAIALNSVTFTLGRAVGPALAAVILLVGGPTLGFVVNAGTYLPLVIVLLVIRQRDVARAGDFDGSVRRVLRLVRADRRLLVLLAATTAIGWTSDPINTLTPPMAAMFGAGDALVGVFVGCFGGGAALHSLILRRVRSRLGLERLGVYGLTGFGVGMILFAVSPTPWLAGVALALAGMAFLGAITSVTTRMQRGIDEDVRGRVMALWGVTFLGSRPIAALIDGGLADLTGPRLATGLAACVALAGAALLAWDGRVAAAPRRNGAG